MARQEQDREDLLAEAKALVERVSLRVGDDDQETVIGFRRNGSVSVFFGASPVYQFTSRKELRRAHVDDLLYKAEAGTLISLRRQRTDTEVQLLRHGLDRDAVKRFLAEMQRRLDQLRQALAAGNFSIVGQVPETADVVGRARSWLDQLGDTVSIANSPRVG